MRLAAAAVSAWGLAPAETRRALRALAVPRRSAVPACSCHAGTQQCCTSSSFPSLASLPSSAVPSLAASGCPQRARRGRRCRVRGCGEEGVLVTDQARAHLEACRISACRGPALDASLRSHARVADCGFSGCAGAQSLRIRCNNI